MTSRRQFLQSLGAGIAGSMLVHSARSGAAEKAARKMNVLFIAVDDLRPQLGCYGDPVVKSPNLDRLAAEGTVFKRAYCQQAVCSPSRTSLMTGRRPDTTRIFNLETHFRDTIPDVVTVSQQFKANGYHAVGMGKIYHGGLDDKQSWSVPHWRPKAPTYLDPSTIEDIKRRTEEAKAGFNGKLPPRWKYIKPRGPAVEGAEAPDNAFADGKVADRAIQVLNEVKDQPFFLSVGFIRPHLPFVAPKKYWDLYDRKALELADNPFAPKDAPGYALSNWGELRKYKGMPDKGPVTDDQARDLIHGYCACTSYTDANIGRVVAELERLGLRENTVIVVWGDHGWQLGEHGMWCKHTNFETSTWSPLIVSAPAQKTKGTPCDALVEFVDIYPSLCDLCHVPLSDGLEGTSFAPLLDEPSKTWKSAAFSQYPRTVKGVGRVMGRSMRTDRYRFTEWRGIKNRTFCEYELYDHESDPKENTNLARRPEHASLVKDLTEMLRGGWQAARPK